MKFNFEKRENQDMSLFDRLGSILKKRIDELEVAIGEAEKEEQEEPSSEVRQILAGLIYQKKELEVLQNQMVNILKKPFENKQEINDNFSNLLKIQEYLIFLKNERRSIFTDNELRELMDVLDEVSDLTSEYARHKSMFNKIHDNENLN